MATKWCCQKSGNASFGISTRKGRTTLEICSKAPVPLNSPPVPAPEASIERLTYHDWPGCFRISNASVEAIVVPAVSRIMQFRLKGDRNGTFWENRDLDGKLHTPACTAWMNFGGEKCWPAPQSAWPLLQGREWPPPVAFDAQPMESAQIKRGVTLTSPADPVCGIQVVRQVELDPILPVLRIRTEYRKLHGSAVTVGIWSIAQLREPERMYVPLPKESNFPEGFVLLMKDQPAQLKISGRLLSLARHPQSFAKLGTDAASLLWIGPRCMLRIDTERKPGIYPNGGCVTEIYTNPGLENYVELETLGPLETIQAGDRIQQTTSYTLLPRTTTDLDEEAAKALR
jgi:hypothetical protein